MKNKITKKIDEVSALLDVDFVLLKISSIYPEILDNTGIKVIPPDKIYFEGVGTLQYQNWKWIITETESKP